MSTLDRVMVAADPTGLTSHQLSLGMPALRSLLEILLILQCIPPMSVPQGAILSPSSSRQCPLLWHSYHKHTFPQGVVVSQPLVHPSSHSSLRAGIGSFVIFLVISVPRIGPGIQQALKGSQEQGCLD